MFHEPNRPEPVTPDLQGMLVHVRSEAFAAEKPESVQTAMFRLTMTIRTYPEHETKHIVLIIPGTAEFQAFVGTLMEALVQGAISTGEIQVVEQNPNPGPSRN